MPLTLSESQFLRGRRTAPVELPAASFEAYTRPQLDAAARSWSLRAGQEHHSAAIFADAVALLTDADVPLDVLAAFARAVGDELRHTELCVAMAARFGARPSPSLPMRRPSVDPSTPARRARGLEIVAMQGAVGETLSCAFLRKGERLAEEPGVKAALRAIRKDEVMHARQSWEALGVLVPALDDAAKAALHAHLRFGLGGVENNLALPAVRQVEAKDHVDPALATLGLVPPADRAHAFYGTIEKRVIPALDELGLDGKLAWSERKRDWAPRSG